MERKKNNFHHDCNVVMLSTLFIPWKIKTVWLTSGWQHFKLLPKVFNDFCVLLSLCLRGREEPGSTHQKLCFPLKIGSSHEAVIVDTYFFHLYISQFFSLFQFRFMFRERAITILTCPFFAFESDHGLITGIAKVRLCKKYHGRFRWYKIIPSLIWGSTMQRSSIDSCV